MKRLKQMTAWLMAICMLNFGGAFSNVSLVASAAAGDDGLSLAYTVLEQASGEAGVTVMVSADATGTEIHIPATVSGDNEGFASGEASADAEYQVTSFSGVQYASGDAKSNALKVIGFEGKVPTSIDASILNALKNNYFVKVLKDNASGDAYNQLKDSDNCYVVSSLDNKLLGVKNPDAVSGDAATFADVEKQLEVKDVVTDEKLNNVTFKWYKDENHQTAVNNNTEIPEDGTYYYTVEASGYEKAASSIELEAADADTEEFTIVSEGVTLTMRVLNNASGDAVRIKSAAASADATAGTPYTIPATAANNGKTYTVTEIGSGVFGDAEKHTKFTSYVIPESVKVIADKAFGQNLSHDDALLLRFMATTKETLPKLSAQYNSNRFGLVFHNQLTESDINSWKNESQSQLSNYQSFFVAYPATDKILKPGNVQASDSALYTQHLSDIAIMATDFTDFETKAAVAVTGGWDNPGYAFSFADSNHNYPYTFWATGYGNRVTGTKTVIPYTASGFSYALEGTGLYVTAYNAGKDSVSSAEKKANKEVDIPAAESDATGATYPVIGINTMNRNTTLEHLNIPASVSNIKEEAFIGCDYMQINVATDNVNYASAGGFLYNKPMTKLISAACASGKTYLPAGIELIGDHAFESNGMVQDLYIPASVTKIGESNNGHSLQATQLRNIYFFNSDNITTLTFMGSVFGGATKNIWVPTGTKAAYEAAIQNQWKGNIELREWIPTYDETLTLTDYKEFPLTAVNGVNKTYTWTTSDANVVGITATTAATANIHAMATSGTATITATATDGSGMSKWQVTVNVPANLVNPWAVPQYSLKVSKSSVTMGAKAGKKVDSITLTVSASDKSKVTVSSASTSNKKVATVTKKGNKITIKAVAKKKGTATITVKDAKGKTVKVKVTVKKAPKKAKLKKSSITLKKKKSYTIALKNTASAKLSFKTSNKKIATVSSSGKVTAKKKGSCKITVTTYNGKKATLKVKVK